MLNKTLRKYSIKPRKREEMDYSSKITLTPMKTHISL